MKNILILLAMFFSQSVVADPGFNASVAEYKASASAIIRHIEHLRNNAARCAPMNGAKFVQPANEVINNMKRDIRWADEFKLRTERALAMDMNPNNADACGGSFQAVITGVEAKRRIIATAREDFKENITDKIRDAAKVLKEKEQDIRWLFSDCAAETQSINAALQQFNQLQQRVRAVDGTLAGKDRELGAYLAQVRRLNQSGCVASR